MTDEQHDHSADDRLYDAVFKLGKRHGYVVSRGEDGLYRVTKESLPYERMADALCAMLTAIQEDG